MFLSCHQHFYVENIHNILAIAKCLPVLIGSNEHENDTHVEGESKPRGRVAETSNLQGPYFDQSQLAYHAFWDS